MTVVLVTGTSTSVGKTVALAALAARSQAGGRSVGVVKPVQTGITMDDPSDVATVERLTGLAGTELVRLDDPLAPDSAARLRAVSIPRTAELARRLATLAQGVEVMYVEGAGGVLVRLDTHGGTLIDLGLQLVERGLDVQVVVVTTVLLGTLNHTELTVDAVRAAGLEVAGLLLGVVPESLGLAEQTNLGELPRVTGLPVLGAIPAGAGGLSRREFTARCQKWVHRTF